MRSLNPRIALRWFVAVNLLGDFLIFPVGFLVANSLYLSSRDLRDVIDLIAQVVASLLFGGLLAQVALLGVWAAAGDKPFLVRWPRSVFLLLFGSIAVFVGAGWVSDLFPPADRFVDSLMPPFAATMVLTIFAGSQAVSCVALLISGHRLVSLEDFKDSRQLTSHQFSLARLIGWTASVAVLLGLGRFLPPQLWEYYPNYVPEAVATAGHGGAAGICLFLALLAAVAPIPPMLYARVTLPQALILDAYYLVALTFGELMLLGIWDFVFESQTHVTFFWEFGMRELPPFGLIFCFNLGFLLELVLTILVVRWCGFRLVKKKLAN